MPEQSKKEETIEKDGYEVTFYPGFASRCRVREADGTEHALYEQDPKKPYRLPPGQTKPDKKHILKLKGGKHRQNVTLEIDDPEYRIARITIELYDETHEAGNATESQSTETLTVDNDAVTCPPNC